MDQFVSLRSAIPILAAKNAGFWVVNQFMSADVLAGLIVGLDELASKVGVLIKGDVGGGLHLLAARPVTDVRQVWNEKSRLVFDGVVAIDGSVGAEAAGLDDTAGSVVNQFLLASTAGILNHNLLSL